eukprot:COSAG05_NODE_73_length_21807_cov_283.593698_8_plen_163_part_00
MGRRRRPAPGSKLDQESNDPRLEEYHEYEAEHAEREAELKRGARREQRKRRRIAGRGFAAATTDQQLEAAEEVPTWFYVDPAGGKQGPFPLRAMREWHAAGYFTPATEVWQMCGVSTGSASYAPPNPRTGALNATRLINPTLRRRPPHYCKQRGNSAAQSLP